MTHAPTTISRQTALADITYLNIINITNNVSACSVGGSGHDRKRFAYNNLALGLDSNAYANK